MDEAGLLKPRIQDRIRRVARNPIRQRKTNLRRAGGWSRDDATSGARRRSGSRAIGSKGTDVKLKKMNVDDLDKELEVYMSNRSAGGN